MNDTSPEIAQMMCELIQMKTPSERAEMGWSMYLTSRALVIDAILRDNPNLTDSQLRQELFLKFYKDDFSEEKREKILQSLANKDLGPFIK